MYGKVLVVVLGVCAGIFSAPVPEPGVGSVVKSTWSKVVVPALVFAGVDGAADHLFSPSKTHTEIIKYIPDPSLEAEKGKVVVTSTETTMYWVGGLISGLALLIGSACAYICKIKPGRKSRPEVNPWEVFFHNTEPHASGAAAPDKPSANQAAKPTPVVRK